MANGSLLQWAWMVHLGRNAHSYLPHSPAARPSTFLNLLPASLPACLLACLIQAGPRRSRSNEEDPLFWGDTAVLVKSNTWATGKRGQGSWLRSLVRAIFF